MKHLKYYKKIGIPLVLYCCLLLACQNDPPAGTADNDEQTEQRLRIEQRTFEKQSGSCAQDSMHCMTVTASYPFLIGGSSAISDPINNTISQHLKTNIGVFAIDSSDLEGSLDSIVTAYIDEFEQLITESPDYPFAWEIEVEGSVFYQSPKVLSVGLNAYSYTGGAHPNIFLDLINFDLTNGEKLLISDLFSDQEQLKMLVEKKFREVREIAPETSIVQAGFFWGDPFTLPENFALQEDGIYFYYNPYEAAAYALGPTEFTIPYSDLKGLMREP